MEVKIKYALWRGLEKVPPLRILKYDLTSNSPMPDVTFEVWHDGDLFGEYTTNASGEIFLYDLNPGTYLVKEVATDDAHVVNSFVLSA